VEKPAPPKSCSVFLPGLGWAASVAVTGGGAPPASSNGHQAAMPGGGGTQGGVTVLAQA
jgi:hypothetical protein